MGGGGGWASRIHVGREGICADVLQNEEAGLREMTVPSHRLPLQGARWGLSVFTAPLLLRTLGPHRAGAERQAGFLHQPPAGWETLKERGNGRRCGDVGGCSGTSFGTGCGPVSGSGLICQGGSPAGEK